MTKKKKLGKRISKISKIGIQKSLTDFVVCVTISHNQERQQLRELDMTERTELQVLQGMYSDVHKDVYGFRPRHCSDELWNSVEALDAEVASLSDTLVVQMEIESKIQADNCRDFETVVENTISSGAGDRQTAVRWLMDGMSVDGDIGYFEYLLNVPYGYVEKSI